MSLIAIEHIVGDNEPFISGTLQNGSRLVCCKQTHQGSRHPTRLSHAKAGYHLTTRLSFVFVGIRSTVRRQSVPTVEVMVSLQRRELVLRT